MSHASHSHALDMLYSAFGMAMIVMGIAGNHRVKITNLEVGPIRREWRAVCVVLGLFVLVGVGSMVYLQEMKTIG